MHDYALTHVSDAILIRDLTAIVTRDRETSAVLLAHIAEVDSRKLHVPAGYASMYSYCVEELRLSEDSASKRIQAARAARRFPRLFHAVAEGRLHLSAVCLLAPHLTPENAADLIEAASDRRKSEIEEMLSRRFPSRDLIRSGCATSAHAPGCVGGEEPTTVSEQHGATVGELSRILNKHAPGHVEHDTNGETVRAAEPERILVRLAIPASTRDKLRYAQALLSHAIPSGDVAQVLDRALDALIAHLERRKYGARSAVARSSGTSPDHYATPAAANSPPSRRSRYLPASLRRAVWERDRGQCTFVSAQGHRCGEGRFLEFDHVEPVARGGTATLDGIRLRCRAHNQYEAERAFGVEFMKRKRQEATTRKEARNQERQQRARTPAKEHTQEIIAGLRALGCRSGEARRAAEAAATSGATLEESMRAALRLFHPALR